MNFKRMQNFPCISRSVTLIIPPRAERRMVQIAGWSSQVARQAHNLKVRGSNPLPATTLKSLNLNGLGLFSWRSKLDRKHQL